MNSQAQVLQLNISSPNLKMKALKEKATEGATTKLLHANSSTTTKKTSSLGLTAALRAAATPRFNQDFQAELRKPRERHKRACLIALGFENQVKNASEECRGAEDVQM